MIFQRRGILFVISAPSGGGKSTLLKRLKPEDGFQYSISCTTRPPRVGEVHGREYFFLSPEEFERRVNAGDFLEHARVHGNRYGTLRETVMDCLVAGQDVLMDVDIQGAAAIRHFSDAEIHSSLVDIFLMPPSFAELKRRLTARATDSAEQIELRLRTAINEMAEWRSYRFTILSGSAEDDETNFRAIVHAERMRSHRMMITP